MTLANRDDAALAAIDGELENRAARTSLIGYVLKTTPNYIVEKIHRQIAGALEAVMRREIRRLMIMAHPTSGKTHFVSKRFPAFYLSQTGFYSHELIHAGYGSEIVLDTGRELRNLLSRPEHLDVFPTVSVSGDSRAADHWTTNKGEIYIASGTGGSIVGRGGDLIILDDCV